MLRKGWLLLNVSSDMRLHLYKSKLPTVTGYTPHLDLAVLMNELSLNCVEAPKPPVR